MPYRPFLFAGSLEDMAEGAKFYVAGGCISATGRTDTGAEENFRARLQKEQYAGGVMYRLDITSMGDVEDKYVCSGMPVRAKE